MLLALFHLNSCLEDIYGHLDKKIFTLPTALHGIYSTGFLSSLPSQPWCQGWFWSFLLQLQICHCDILWISPHWFLITFSLITLCPLIWGHWAFFSWLHQIPAPHCCLWIFLYTNSSSEVLIPFLLILESSSELEGSQLRNCFSKSLFHWKKTINKKQLLTAVT